MMTVLFTCPSCGSGIHVYPSVANKQVSCDICQHQFEATFDQDHEASLLKNCPHCQGFRFYKQKDFNRKVGVILFVIASILAIFTYGISLIVLYIIDFFLFSKLQMIAICYKCSAVFKNVKNINEIEYFDHETNDRTVYGNTHETESNK